MAWIYHLSQLAKPKYKRRKKNNNNNTRDITLLQIFKKYDILGGRRHIVPLTIKFKPH
jgi:hypothetical protein